MLSIRALSRQRQEDPYEFDTSLIYIVSFGTAKATSETLLQTNNNKIKFKTLSLNGARNTLSGEGLLSCGMQRLSVLKGKPSLLPTSFQKLCSMGHRGKNGILLT